VEVGEEDGGHQAGAQVRQQVQRLAGGSTGAGRGGSRGGMRMAVSGKARLGKHGCWFPVREKLAIGGDRGGQLQRQRAAGSSGAHRGRWRPPPLTMPAMTPTPRHVMPSAVLPANLACS
jgi:hypothetical protein